MVWNLNGIPKLDQTFKYIQNGIPNCCHNIQYYNKCRTVWYLYLHCISSGKGRFGRCPYEASNFVKALNTFKICLSCWYKVKQIISTSEEARTSSNLAMSQTSSGNPYLIDGIQEAMLIYFDMLKIIVQLQMLYSQLED